MFMLPNVFILHGEVKILKSGVQIGLLNGFVPVRPLDAALISLWESVTTAVRGSDISFCASVAVHLSLS